MAVLALVPGAAGAAGHYAWYGPAAGLVTTLNNPVLCRAQSAGVVSGARSAPLAAEATEQWACHEWPKGRLIQGDEPYWALPALTGNWNEPSTEWGAWHVFNW